MSDHAYLMHACHRSRILQACEWIVQHPAEAAAIGANAQAFARERLTYAAAVTELRRVLSTMAD